MWLERLNTKKLDAEFLLTHPVWDVTTVLNTDSALKAFLLTHPVWDVTNRRRPYKRLNFISTHTSRVGCDSLLPIISVRFSISTHTSRVGCDSVNIVSLSHTIISTHTSRVGCDNPVMNCLRGYINFYSHIPCGMWPQDQPWTPLVDDFYSHIPCGMWRCSRRLMPTTRCNFYSHIPCGMWHNRQQRRICCLRNFYSHIPCGMWHSSSVIPSALEIFLLTHPVWDVTFTRVRVYTFTTFLLTHPVWDVTELSDTIYA